MYADDLLLLSPTVGGMQALLHIFVILMAVLIILFLILRRQLAL